ncbi:hypothetical protein [Paenibacillus sp. NPDC057934]|uniref:hypothetical protein n=1 Tax=Paenibacillus sp. NPDC057934 TaxID=3346282 RepID=UPI0036D7F281
MKQCVQQEQLSGGEMDKVMQQGIELLIRATICARIEGLEAVNGKPSLRDQTGCSMKGNGLFAASIIDLSHATIGDFILLGILGWYSAYKSQGAAFVINS